MEIESVTGWPVPVSISRTSSRRVKRCCSSSAMRFASNTKKNLLLSYLLYTPSMAVTKSLTLRSTSESTLLRWNCLSVIRSS